MWKLILLALVLVLIVVPALCNPRLLKDLKTGGSSMDDVLQQGHDDLKAALRAGKQKKKITNNTKLPRHAGGAFPSNSPMIPRTSEKPLAFCREV